MIRSSNRFHWLVASFYFYKERVCDRSVQLQEIRRNGRKLLLKIFVKFRLISEEATSGTPFIRKRAVTRLLSQPFIRLFINHFVVIASYA